MLEKRLTQADLQLIFHSANEDAHSLARDLANLICDPDCFRRYLKDFPALEPEPLRDVEGEILSFIKTETPQWHVYSTFALPFKWLESILERLESEGKIRSEKTPEKGTLYTRLAG
jgi:hypothetical protein